MDLKGHKSNVLLKQPIPLSGGHVLHTLATRRHSAVLKHSPKHYGQQLMFVGLGHMVLTGPNKGSVAEGIEY